MPLQREIDKIRNKLVDQHAGDRGLRVVFIPWDFTEGQEWTLKTEQWNHATGNKYRIVHYTPGMRNPYLGQVSHDPKGVVYLRGHGNPGVPYIQVKVNVGLEAIEERKLLITEACDRLIASGLDPTFAGVIKFFHCHSGTVLTQAAYEEELRKFESNNRMVKEAFQQGSITAEQKRQFWKEIHPNKSIARNGADYLRKKGYGKCIYYGYLGPLASEYGDDGHGAMHKNIELAGLQRPPPHLVGVQTTRASLARVQV